MIKFDALRRHTAKRSITPSEIVALGAADDVRLYVAMCASRHLPWNLRLFAEDVYRGQLGGSIGDRAIANWIASDPVCKAINSPESSDVKDAWAAKADEELDSWDT